jgi:hypothetical protein
MKDIVVEAFFLARALGQSLRCFAGYERPREG